MRRGETGRLEDLCLSGAYVNLHCRKQAIFYDYRRGQKLVRDAQEVFYLLG